MFKTFFREFTTQSNTALSLGSRLMVLRGLRTRRTLRDLMVLISFPLDPLEGRGG